MSPEKQQQIEDWNISFINEWYALFDANYTSDEPKDEETMFRHWVIEKLAMLAAMETHDYAQLGACIDLIREGETPPSPTGFI